LTREFFDFRDQTSAGDRRTTACVQCKPRSKHRERWIQEHDKRAPDLASLLQEFCNTGCCRRSPAKCDDCRFAIEFTCECCAHGLRFGRAKAHLTALDECFICRREAEARGCEIIKINRPHPERVRQRCCER
jgi:hypothetical protein